MKKILDIIYHPGLDCNLAVYQDIFGLTWVAQRKWFGQPIKVNLEHLEYSELKDRLEPLRRVSKIWAMRELLNKAGE